MLGTGAGALALAGAIVVGDATHRLDDAARAIGIKPRPRPAVSDEALIATAAEDQNLVLAAIESTSARHQALTSKLAPFAKIGQEHVTAVGGSSTVPTADAVDADPAKAVKALVQTLSTTSAARAKDAGMAVSPDLARVLSSMSAGLAQGARALGALA